MVRFVYAESFDDIFILYNLQKNTAILRDSDQFDNESIIFINDPEQGEVVYTQGKFYIGGSYTNTDNTNTENNTNTPRIEPKKQRNIEWETLGDWSIYSEENKLNKFIVYKTLKEEIEVPVENNDEQTENNESLEENNEQTENTEPSENNENNEQTENNENPQFIITEVSNPIHTFFTQVYWNIEHPTDEDTYILMNRVFFTTIPDAAFMNCITLNDIQLPDTVDTISEYAFAGCINLPTFVIKDDIEYIGKNAFKDVPNIEYHGELLDPKYIVTNLDGTTTEYTVEEFDELDPETIEGEVEFVEFEHGAKSVNGYVEGMFVCDSDEKNEIRACIPYLATDTIIIPNGVKKICKHTFTNCAGIVNLILPDSLTEIESGAFDELIDIASVSYQGTSQQWREITVYDDTFIASNIEYIACSDNTVVDVYENATTYLFDDGTRFNTFSKTINFDTCQEDLRYKIIGIAIGKCVTTIEPYGIGKFVENARNVGYVLTVSYKGTITEFEQIDKQKSWANSYFAEGQYMEYEKLVIEAIQCIDGVYDVLNIEGTSVLTEQGEVITRSKDVFLERFSTTTDESNGTKINRDQVPLVREIKFGRCIRLIKANIFNIFALGLNIRISYNGTIEDWKYTMREVRWWYGEVSQDGNYVHNEVANWDTPVYCSDGLCLAGEWNIMAKINDLIVNIFDDIKDFKINSTSETTVLQKLKDGYINLTLSEENPYDFSNITELYFNAYFRLISLKLYYQQFPNLKKVYILGSTYDYKYRDLSNSLTDNSVFDELILSNEKQIMEKRLIITTTDDIVIRLNNFGMFKSDLNHLGVDIKKMYIWDWFNIHKGALDGCYNIQEIKVDNYIGNFVRMLREDGTNNNADSETSVDSVFEMSSAKVVNCIDGDFVMYSGETRFIFEDTNYVKTNADSLDGSKTNNMRNRYYYYKKTVCGINTTGILYNVTGLHIGKSVKRLNYHMFWYGSSGDAVCIYDGNGSTSVTYEGTLEEWNKISKNIYWNEGTPITTVECSDGTITL